MQLHDPVSACLKSSCSGLQHRLSDPVRSAGTALPAASVLDLRKASQALQEIRVPSHFGSVAVLCRHLQATSIAAVTSAMLAVCRGVRCELNSRFTVLSCSHPSFPHVADGSSTLGPTYLSMYCSDPPQCWGIPMYSCQAFQCCNKHLM